MALEPGEVRTCPRGVTIGLEYNEKRLQTLAPIMCSLATLCIEKNELMNLKRAAAETGVTVVIDQESGECIQPK